MPVHPPYRDVPPADTLGLRHVREALADLAFPATTDEIRARAGSWRIPVTGVVFERLDELLEDVPDKRFRDADQVARAIGRAHPELRD